MSVRFVYPCWTCGGTGKVEVTYWVTYSTAATSIPDNLWTTCPACNGDGRQRVPPVPSDARISTDPEPRP